MRQNWYLLYSTLSLPQASIIKGMLEENGIPVMIVNKQSSSYISLGDIEVYVPDDLKNTARQLLDQGISN